MKLVQFSCTNLYTICSEKSVFFFSKIFKNRKTYQLGEYELEHEYCIRSGSLVVGVASMGWRGTVCLNILRRTRNILYPYYLWDS